MLCDLFKIQLQKRTWRINIFVDWILFQVSWQIRGRGLANLNRELVWKTNCNGRLSAWLDAVNCLASWVSARIMRVSNVFSHRAVSVAMRYSFLPFCMSVYQWSFCHHSWYATVPRRRIHTGRKTELRPATPPTKLPTLVSTSFLLRPRTPFLFTFVSNITESVAGKKVNF